MHPTFLRTALALRLRSRPHLTRISPSLLPAEKEDLTLKDFHLVACFVFCIQSPWLQPFSRRNVLGRQQLKGSR